jgi:hypothetical protein
MPSAALTQKSAFVPVLLALPAHAQDFTPAAETVTASSPHPLVFYQQHHWRPYSGRAPPVLL